MWELDLAFQTIIFLMGSAFLAGFVDAIAGGGGLIQLPSLLIAAPQYSLPMLFGTNKLASIFGTSTALYRYSRKLSIPYKLIWPAAVAAFGGSFLGASFVEKFPKDWLEVFVLILLILVSLHSFFNKQFGLVDRIKPHGRRDYLSAVLIGFGLGFYDGFFGPGTGGFLIFLFILFLGLDFLRASASSKLVNVATNLAALCYFIPSGNVIFLLGLPMGVCNMAGGFVGSHVAISKGSRWVRVLFLIVVAAIQIRLGWQIWGSHFNG